jgi:hypothetical protein
MGTGLMDGNELVLLLVVGLVIFIVLLLASYKFVERITPSPRYGKPEEL